MLSKLLEQFAGWLLGIALLLAPFLYGGTTDQAIRTLNGLLMAASILWLAGCVSGRRWPHVNIPVTVACMVLLVQGWWMSFNAHAIFDPEFWMAASKEPPVPGLPGSWDAIGSHTFMIRLTALVAALLAMIDLCQRSRWIRRFQATMAAASIALAAVGIWQKIAFAPLKIWAVENVPSTVFATFWYHGNAAAFLNVTWPLAVAAAICSFAFGGSHLMRSVWIAGTMLVIAGLAVNVSKAGHAVAAVLLAGLIIMILVRARTLLAQYGWRQVLVGGALAITGVLWLIMQMDHSAAIQRWKQFLAREDWDSRFLVADQSLDLMKDTGWFGSGPGTFGAVFHQYRREHSLDTKVAWKYAHNDYVQSAVEWGLPGTLAWAVIWGTACAGGVRVLWKWLKPAFFKTRKRSRSDRERWRKSREAMLLILLTGAFVSLAGLLMHAAIDFPLQIYSTHLYGMALAAMLISRHASSAKKSISAPPTSEPILQGDEDGGNAGPRPVPGDQRQPVMRAGGASNFHSQR